MIRGERFQVNLDSDHDDDESTRHDDVPPPATFVKDVLERKPAAPKLPSAPTIKSKSGFPEHRKRNVESRFKQQTKSSSAIKNSEPDQDAAASTSGLGSAGAGPASLSTVAGGEARSWEAEERARIDQENRQKLAQMSPEEIEEERQELMNSISPGLLQRLLQRSNLESGSSEANLALPLANEPRLPKKPPNTTTKEVAFEEPEEEASVNTAAQLDDQESSPAEELPHDSVHFPRPPQPPDLDPSSDTFFDDLHQKYFPSLPSEPDKLEWMQSSAPSRVVYDPSASAFNPSEIRFSFKGELIPPRTAAEIPVTEGLHHHGDAPDAAGYTIAELAHLARSTYPAQRCIAFQTLGRILFRLGRGEFGDAGEPGQDLPGAQDTFGELARGLWREVEKTHVIKTLTVESEGNGVDGGRHVSAKAYATEAVWLWQRGGGRRWKAE